MLAFHDWFRCSSARESPLEVLAAIPPRAGGGVLPATGSPRAQSDFAIHGHYQARSSEGTPPLLQLERLERGDSCAWRTGPRNAAPGEECPPNARAGQERLTGRLSGDNTGRPETLFPQPYGEDRGSSLPRFEHLHEWFECSQSVQIPVPGAPAATSAATRAGCLQFRRGTESRYWPSQSDHSGAEALR